MYSFDFFVYYMLLVILLLLSVAFLTLLERKILSYSQMRKGPNKVGFLGLVQPFVDGIKLFSKMEVFLIMGNKLFFFFSPSFSFLVSLLIWLSIFSYSGFSDLKYSLLFFLSCVGVSVYGLIFSGWGSNSKYSVLGSLRAVAQTVSYELNLTFLIFLVGFFVMSFSVSFGVWNSMIFVLFNILVCFFFVICVVETNRAPFDLAEGESELVSGFNTEYGGLKFALIFLAEYGSILWMSFFFSFLFFSFWLFSFFVLIFIFFRSSFPRFRYDFLMDLNWKIILFVLFFFYFFFLFLT